MAYFRCQQGSSSGGAGATITVTYDSSFYNKTMTCTNGTKTYTKTTTSSGSTTFNVNEEGTWTITCNGVSKTVNVVLSYTTQMAITKTITIHGANEDYITYTDATGSKVCQFASGATSKSVSITFIPPSQSITFTSTVAKNPNNLSQNYSKAITITESTTAIYVMPDNVIYWYGYGDAPSVADSNLVISSSYGWTKINGITKNTNNVTIVKPTTLKQYCATRSTNLYNFSGKTVHTIINSSHLTDNTGGDNQYVLAWGEYGGGADIAGIGYIDSSLPYLENVGVAMGVNVNAVVYAIWLE